MGGSRLRQGPLVPMIQVNLCTKEGAPSNFCSSKRVCRLLETVSGLHPRRDLAGSFFNFYLILVRYFHLLGLTVAQASKCRLPLIQPTNIRGVSQVGVKRFRVDQRFKELQKQLFGLAEYTMHCIRVGGSEHALACGVDPMLSKAHGLWSSDNYFRYLFPSQPTRLRTCPFIGWCGGSHAAD